MNFCHSVYYIISLLHCDIRVEICLYYEKMFECGPSTKQRRAFIQSYNYVFCFYNNNNNNNNNTEIMVDSSQD